MELLAPVTKPHLGAGIALTAVGDFVGQAIYWTVASFDPLGIAPDGNPKGWLMYDVTITGSDMRSVNFYFAPAGGTGTIRYGTQRRFGVGYKWGEEITAIVGDGERVIIRSGDA